MKTKTKTKIKMKMKMMKMKIKMAIYCPQGSGTLRQQLLMMHGIAGDCVVSHGIALYCIVLHGIAWYCMVLHDIAWYCIVLSGLHKLWYPGIRDRSTWSKFGAHGEHGDVFLFSNLGALWFSENLIRYSLHVCLREVKNNLFSFKHSYLRHFSWRF